MRIVYYANFHNQGSDDTEGHIARALTELGHEVIKVDLGEECPEGDMLLFHKGHPDNFKGIKVCWYFDKVWSDLRKNYIKNTLAWTDYLFITDETYTIEHPHPKFRIMRQGIGDSMTGAKFKTDAKIAFVGSVYGDRHGFAQELYKEFGDDFQVFSNYFNRNLNNLCASVPIFVAPIYPSDDHYWSNRVYIITGSGGFLLHPRLKGLEAEYEDGKEIVFYDGMADLKRKIHYYLDHPEEREAIRFFGHKKTRENYTYKKRIEQIIAHCSK